MPIKLVLLDLDDTLLGGSMAALWSDYFPLVDQWMSDRLGLPNFLPRLLRATQHMVKTADQAAPRLLRGKTVGFSRR